MAKKKTQIIPKYIQAKFKKPQYKVGNVVYITWLGERKIGKIIEIIKRNEQSYYKVKSIGKLYTCGIEINNYKSSRDAPGFILANETDNSGQSSLRKEFNNSTISRKPRGAASSTPDSSTSSRQSINNNNKSTSNSRIRKNVDTKNSHEHGTSYVNKKKSQSVTRKKTKLNKTAQQQRDFLSGFVKN